MIECLTVRMGQRRWTVLAAGTLNLLAGMDLALTHGGNVMGGLTVETSQTKMSGSAVGAGWENFAVPVEMSV